jgi:hypothetical protein
LPLAGLLVGAFFGTPSAEVLSLETARLCDFKIHGVKVQDALLVAHRDDLQRFLDDVAFVRVKSCQYVMIAGSTKETQGAWVVKNNAKSLPADDPRNSLSKGNVLVKLKDASQVFAIFRASAPSHLRASAAGGAENPPPPGSETAASAVPASSEPQKCEEAGSVCVDKDGEVSIEIPCGPFSVELSTTGEVTIGVKGTVAGASITLGGDAGR